MKYRQHNDALVAYTKVNAVWKTLGNGFAYVAMNDGKLLGCGRNAGQQQADFGEKLKTQTSAFFLVPVASIVKLTPRLPPKGNS
jgi:hypothetical protein